MWDAVWLIVVSHVVILFMTDADAINVNALLIAHHLLNHCHPRINLPCCK